MYSLYDIEYFINTECKVTYFEINLIKNTIKKHKDNSDIDLLNIVYNNSFDFYTPINIEYLKHYRNHLLKLKTHRFRGKLMSSINNAYIVTDSYMYIIHLMRIKKKLAFGKLVSNRFINNPLLYYINTDIIFSVLKLI